MGSRPIRSAVWRDGTFPACLRFARSKGGAFALLAFSAIAPGACRCSPDAAEGVVTERAAESEPLAAAAAAGGAPAPGSQRAPSSGTAHARLAAESGLVGAPGASLPGSVATSPAPDGSVPTDHAVALPPGAPGALPAQASGSAAPASAHPPGAGPRAAAVGPASGGRGPGAAGHAAGAATHATGLAPSPTQVAGGAGGAGAAPRGATAAGAATPGGAAASGGAQPQAAHPSRSLDEEAARGASSAASAYDRGGGGPSGNESGASTSSSRQSGPPQADPSTIVDRFIEQGGRALGGVVVDVESRSPVSGARVEVWMGMRTMLTETDAAGRFRFDGLVPGSRVTLWITASPTYVQEHSDVRIPAERSLLDARFGLLTRQASRSDGDGDGGIGIFLGHRADRLVVTGLTAFGPAERGGVAVGDIVLAISGRSVAGLGPGAVDHLLRGRIGSEMELKIQSPGSEPRRVSLHRVAR